VTLGDLKERLDRRPSNPFFSDVPKSARVRKRYLIGTSARSGSTYLCSRLCDSGALGFPMEFINESYIYEFERVFPNPSLNDYERYLANHFCSSEGVFGIKSDYYRFEEALRLGLLSSLIQPLDLVIHLWREDYVAQAVSFHLAKETNVWHSRDLFGRNLEDLHAAVPYSARAIKEHARSIVNQEYWWRWYIRTSGAPALDLSYESLLQDLGGVVRQLSEALDVDAPEMLPSSRAISRATSDVSRSWCDRFRDECEDFVEFWDEHRGLITAQ